MIEERIGPFGIIEAKIASSYLIRPVEGGLQPDCFIAAMAISSSALLATGNRKDFVPFLARGLRLA